MDRCNLCYSWFCQDCSGVTPDISFDVSKNDFFCGSCLQQRYMRSHTIESADNAYSMLRDEIEKGLKAVTESMNKKWANLQRQTKSEKLLSNKLIARVDKMEKSLRDLTKEIQELRSNQQPSLLAATSVSSPPGTDRTKSSSKLPQPQRRRGRRRRPRQQPPETPTPSPPESPSPGGTLPPPLPLDEFIAGRTRSQKRNLKGEDEKEAAEIDEDEPPSKRQRTSSETTKTTRKKTTKKKAPVSEKSAPKKKTTPAKKKKAPVKPKKKPPVQPKEKAPTKPKSKKKASAKPKKKADRASTIAKPGGVVGIRVRQSSRLKKKKKRQRRASSGSDSSCMTIALLCMI